MKNIIFLLLFMPVFCFSQKSTQTVSYAILNHRILELQDSVSLLKKRPVMSVEQFVNLYKYDRLLKYYKICKHKPTQWKYYKGWSIRVFEQ